MSRPRLSRCVSPQNPKDFTDDGFGTWGGSEANGEMQDIPYLQPYIKEIEREIAERKELDSLTKAK
jgi:hypothetical protein